MLSILNSFFFVVYMYAYLSEDSTRLLVTLLCWNHKKYFFFVFFFITISKKKQNRRHPKLKACVSKTICILLTIFFFYFVRPNDVCPNALSSACLSLSVHTFCMKCFAFTVISSMRCGGGVWWWHSIC